MVDPTPICIDLLNHLSKMHSELRRTTAGSLTSLRTYMDLTSIFITGLTLSEPAHENVSLRPRDLFVVVVAVVAIFILALSTSIVFCATPGAFDVNFIGSSR